MPTEDYIKAQKAYWDKAVQKNKDASPIFMTISFACFSKWYMGICEEKYKDLDQEAREILCTELCQKQWRKLFEFAKDYNI